MHKVQLMEQTPTQCLHCGRGNTPDDPDTMDDFWAVDLERDVNWGDSTYICKYCCDVLAATAGYVTHEQLLEQQQLADNLRAELHDSKAELASYKRRVRVVMAGKKTEKRIRKQIETEPDEEPKPKKKRRAA